MLASLPANEPGAVPGLYLLDVHLLKPSILTPGRLGQQNFKPGNYLYVGSARGPGGLRARLERHHRFPRSPVRHWHIDHLLSIGKLLNYWWCAADKERECDWADHLSHGGDRWPRGFGSSDCRCAGHLIYFRNPEMLRESVQSLGAHVSGMHSGQWMP